MKAFLVLLLVATSVLSEAPYPPSGYRPLGPQFELPPRTERPETDVETFSDTVVVQDATDRQLNNNNLWPTSQQLPTLLPARFRTYPLINGIPFQRATNVEFYQAPVQLLRTEINYPVDRRSPIIRTTTFANVNERNLQINNKEEAKTGVKSLKETEKETNTDDFKSSDENSFTETKVDDYETTTIKPVKQNARFRTVVRRKILRTSKAGANSKEAGRELNSANDLSEHQQALFVRNSEGSSKQKSMQRSRSGSRIDSLSKSADQKLGQRVQGATNTDYDNTSESLALDDGNDNSVSNSQSSQIPQDTYGAPAIEVTSSRPRRRKTRRRKITTTSSTTEEPGYTETEEPVPESENPNVAISTAVAGLPPSVYVVQEPTSGQLQFLRLRVE